LSEDLKQKGVKRPHSSADISSRVVGNKDVPEFLQADLDLFLTTALTPSFDKEIFIHQLHFTIRLLIEFQG